MEVAAIDLPEATTTTEQPTSCFATIEQLGSTPKKKDRLQLRVRRQLLPWKSYGLLIKIGYKDTGEELPTKWSFKTTPFVKDLTKA